MINKFYSLKWSIFEYILGFFIYTSIMIAIFGNNFYIVNELYKNNLTSTAKKTISEYGEIDLEHLCTISNCSQIGFIDEPFSFSPGKTHLIKNKQSEIIKQLWKNKNKSHFNLKLLFITSFNKELNKNLLLFIPKYKLFIISNTNKAFLTILKMYLEIYVVLLMILSILFFEYKRKLKKHSELNIINSSNILREKNMQILTENIHHELNTPVAIIQGGVLKLEANVLAEMKKIKNCLINCSTTQKTELVDFGLIYSSIDQINTVLERMSNFKHLRYSNGNKNLKDIINYSMNSMSIYKAAHFKISSSDDLANWGLYHGDTYLKNEDLLNIISNHFRNSIEATSTKIEVQLKITKTKFSYFNAHIFIIDNGNGLRDKETGLLLSPSKYQNIFKDYYSSKNKDGESKVQQSRGKIIDFFLTLKSTFSKNNFSKPNSGSRGVGLYLNKELLKENHGDLKLRETSEKGTAFEIIVPVVEFYKKDE